MGKKKIEIPKNITYCTNDSCPRDCERCVSNHNFNNQILQMSNYHITCESNEDECEYYIPIDLNEKSYAVWGDFEFRPPTYFDGHFEPDIYDLVKWETHEPYEVTDMKTGEKKISTRNCFSIGKLIWDEREPGFNFHSCGLRYLENRVDGLEEFILEFAEKVYRDRRDS